MTARSTLKLLLALVLGLPILQAVLAWVGDLLTAMGDAASAGVLGHLNLTARVLWLVCVVGLVIALAVNSLDDAQSD